MLSNFTQLLGGLATAATALAMSMSAMASAPASASGSPVAKVYYASPYEESSVSLKNLVLVNRAGETTVGVSRAGEVPAGFQFGVDKVNKYAVVTSYTGTDADVVIPDEIEFEGVTYPVTMIYPKAFTGPQTMKTLTFGKNIKETVTGCMTACMNLTEIKVNEGFEKFGDKTMSTFMTKLTKVNFPASLKSIGEQAFMSARIEGEVVFYKDLEHIGGGAFSGNRITGFYFNDDQNPHFKSVDGSIYSKDGSTLLVMPPALIGSKLELPADLKHLGDYALYGNSSLKEVVMPAGLETIGKQALAQCNLTEFKIGPKVVKIGDGVIRGNSKLATITVDPANTKFKVEDSKYLIDIDNKMLLAATMFTGDFIVPQGIEKIAEYANYRNTGLTGFVAPASVKEIGDQAFNNCTNIAKIEFPGVEKIGDYSFEKSSKVKAIVFPNTLKYLGTTAFAYSTSLEEVNLPQSLTEMGRAIFYGCTALKKANIPGTVKDKIGDAVYYQCSALEEVELGEGLETVPTTTFNFCPALKKANIPSTIKYIGQAAFQNAPIPSFDLPEGLEEVGGSSLYGTKMTTLVIPSTLKKMGEFAFAWNKELTEVTFKAPIQTISQYAFHTDNMLSKINLPEGVESIEYKAFSLCYSLRDITIPSTVTTVADSVFQKTPLLVLTNLATTPQPIATGISGNPWYKPGTDLAQKPWEAPNIYDTCKLQVPKASVNAYKAANIWKNFENIIGIESGIDDIVGENGEAIILEVYSIDGRRLPGLTKGINICKMSDGKVVKIYNKE